MLLAILAIAACVIHHVLYVWRRGVIKLKKNGETSRISSRLTHKTLWPWTKFTKTSFMPVLYEKRTQKRILCVSTQGIHFRILSGWRVPLKLLFGKKKPFKGSVSKWVISKLGAECTRVAIMMMKSDFKSQTLSILYLLRPAGHDFLLPICNYKLHRRSFVVRCLFNFLIV